MTLGSHVGFDFTITDSNDPWISRSIWGHNNWSKSWSLVILRSQSCRIWSVHSDECRKLKIITKSSKFFFFNGDPFTNQLYWVSYFCGILISSVSVLDEATWMVCYLRPVHQPVIKEDSQVLINYAHLCTGSHVCVSN